MATPSNGDGFRRLGLIFTPLALLAIIMATPAAAQNPHGQTFDSWRVRCNTPTGAPASCQIFQNIVVKDSGQPVLNVAVGYGQGAKAPVGIFVVPLGIYLPSGMTLQVDDGQVYEMSIEICGPKGCRVRFSFDDNLLNLFKGGKAAKITFYGGDQKPISVPVSLKGFTAALKKVQ